MTDQRINKEGDGDGTNQIAEVVHALGDGTGDQGCGGAAEHHLKQEDANQAGTGIVAQKKVAATKPAANTIAKHNGKPNDPEQGAGDDKVADVFGRDIDTVFASYPTAFEAQEARLHNKDENCGYGDPECIHRLIDSCYLFRVLVVKRRG